MAGERVRKQIMPKGLQDQDWALDERIIEREILIIPDALSLQGWRSHTDADNYEQKNAQPFSAQISCELQEAGTWSPIANYGRARNRVRDTQSNERGW
jgi:hypothetical protein